MAMTLAGQQLEVGLHLHLHIFMENQALQSQTSHQPTNTGLGSPGPNRAASREQYVSWSTEPPCPTLIRAAAQEFSLVSSPYFHPLAPAHLFQLKSYGFVLSRLSSEG